MTDDPDAPTGQVVDRRPPPSPEAPDQPEPPGASRLEAEVEVSWEHPAGATVAPTRS